ncbi:MAG: carboxypeptidase-like regulatory domain-containing protein [Lachnospiraceae bacterium]|nr:carboxypeptidase-like regulatory domain-containing protein [Lachnospiraceae bacterium]
MIKKTKGIITFALMVIFILQIFFENIIVTKAEEENKVQVIVKDQEEIIDNAMARVILQDGSSVILEKCSGGVYESPIVSENAVNGKYFITVNADGYKEIEKEIDFTMDSTILKGELDISDHKLFQVTGKVCDFDKKLPLREVSVAINQLDGNLENQLSTKTDEDGNFSFNVTAGKYEIFFRADNYKTIVQEVTVANELNLENVEMKKIYEYSLNVINPNDGTVTVKVNDEARDIVDGKIICVDGDRIQIIASPKPYYKLADSCMSEMQTDVQDGSEFYLSKNVGEDNIYSYTIEFQKMQYAEIKYDGSSINYIRQMEGGTVVSENSTDFKVLPETSSKFYVKDIIGEVSNIEQELYRFKEKGTAKIYFDKDEDKPIISLSETDDSIDRVYIGGIKDIFVVVKDEKTSVKEVFYKIGTEGYKEAVKEGDNLYRIRVPSNLNLENDLFVKAKDVFENEEERKFKIYYDNSPPVIKSVSLNSTVPVCMQGDKQYIKLKDEAGNKKENLTAFQIDIEDESITKNIKYYISDKILTADQLAKKLESSEETDSFIETEELNISGQGTYSLEVNLNSLKTGCYYIYISGEDVAENIQKENLGQYCFYIDNEPPKVVKAEDISDNKEKWKRPSDFIKFNFIFSDEETPENMEYLYEIGDINEDSSSIEYTNEWKRVEKIGNDFCVISEIGCLPEGAYKLFVRAKDGCNNLSEVLETEFYIDGTAPYIEDMKFDVKENNKKVENSYSFQFGNFFRKDKTQTVEYQVKASDVVNSSYGKNVPAIKEIRLYYINIKVKEELEQEEDFKKNINNQHEMPTFNNSKNYELPYKHENGIYYFRLNIPSVNDFYEILCVASDKAGNMAYCVPAQEGLENRSYSNRVMVDRKIPEISMTLDGKYCTPDYIEEVGTEIRNWYKGEKNVTYQIRVKDEESGLSRGVIKINEKVENLIFSTNIVKNMTTEETYTISSSNGNRSKNDQYSFYVQVQDNAGNVAEKTESIYIDKEKPIITSIKFSNGNVDNLATAPKQYGYFFKKATRVTVTATDFAKDQKTPGSGIKEIICYKENASGKKVKIKNLKLKKGKNNTYTVSFSLPSDFKGRICVKAIDNVGQVSEDYNSKGIVIENAQKHKKYSYARISLPKTAYQDSEGNPLYNYMPLLKMEIGDVRTGISKGSWSVKAYNDSEAENKGNLKVQSTYDKKKNSWTASFNGDDKWKAVSGLESNLVIGALKNYRICSEKNHMEATLEITDNIGYVSKAKKGIFSVDMTAPKIEIEYDNNESFHEKYYKEARHATITVEEANFSKEKCKMEITGPEVEISEWDHISGSGCDGKIHVKDCKWKCVVGFVEDGDYTFSFDCTDLAGWTGSYGKVDEFIIDKTKPVVEVSYDNNEVKNELYYKEARIATISIEEHNFMPEDVEISITAKDGEKEIAVPQVRGWTTNEDIHKATIAYDYNGEFVFHVKYTDLADNEAEEFVSHHFIVDLSEPEINIKGVIDKSANNGVVLPVISCLDKNIEDVQITLSGSNRGKIKCEYKKSNIKDGFVYELSDIVHKKEYDDLYTLSVRAIDKAGNIKEDAIIYSINRFGSVYVLDKETQFLVDNTYTSEEKELRLKELNVDSLESIKVTCSKDGEIRNLNQGSEYNIHKTGGNLSWKEYDYTINKENFQEEGRYIITIYSEDRATNQSDNQVKGKRIEFVVDKTSPTILVSGIENNGQYTEDKRSMTLNVEDNIGLYSVKILSGERTIKTFNKEQIQELNGNLSVELNSSHSWQKIKVIAKDVTGNQTESIVFNVLLTKNLFIQWYRNPWLFYGTILGFVIFFAILYKIIQKK